MAGKCSLVGIILCVLLASLLASLLFLTGTSPIVIPKVDKKGAPQYAQNSEPTVEEFEILCEMVCPRKSLNSKWAACYFQHPDICLGPLGLGHSDTILVTETVTNAMYYLCIAVLLFTMAMLTMVVQACRGRIAWIGHENEEQNATPDQVIVLGGK